MPGSRDAVLARFDDCWVMVPSPPENDKFSIIQNYELFYIQQNISTTFCYKITAPIHAHARKAGAAGV